MKEFLEKLLKDTRRVEKRKMDSYKFDNTFIEFSLIDTRKLADEIVANNLVKFFGDKAKDKDYNRFAVTFKMDSKLRRDQVKLERDSMIGEFKKSIEGKNDNLIDTYKDVKVLFVTYKAFLIELGNIIPEYKYILRNLLKLKDIKDCREIVENLFKFMDDKNKELKNIRTEESEENLEVDSFIEFFRNLNSSKTDYLVDKLALLVKDLENDSTKERELFLLKNLFNFFKNNGLTPIKKLKSESSLYVGLKDIEDGEYIGQPFLEDEKKNVVIERMGWKYRNVQISPIVYKEIKIVNSVEEDM
ncbi:MAG: hypothetical protein ACRDAQ_05565 [Cetobacterium sp.]